jgi:hypothetical protein
LKAKFRNSPVSVIATLLKTSIFAAQVQLTALPTLLKYMAERYNTYKILTGENEVLVLAFAFFGLASHSSVLS